MNLHDSMADVVSKALRGLELSPSSVAEQIGIPNESLIRFLRGGPAGNWISRLGPALGLDAEALCSMDRERPGVDPASIVHQWNLPFEDDRVNAWHIEHPDGSLIIDAGFQPTDLTAYASNLSPFDLLITHPHRDHIGGLSALSSKAQQIYTPAPLPNACVVTLGQSFDSGPWQIGVFDLVGHHPTAVGYRIRGEGHDWVAVGDAIFARSIGGCAGKDAYQRARRTLMTLWPSLTPDTVILPGHGPATTVALESRSNPFIAGWLNS